MHPKLEPGGGGMLPEANFALSGESGLASTNLNLQSVPTSLTPTAALPAPAINSFHWPSYSANYKEVYNIPYIAQIIKIFVFHFESFVSSSLVYKINFENFYCKNANRMLLL